MFTENDIKRVVHSTEFGYGRITAFHESSDYPVEVEFTDGTIYEFTADGRLDADEPVEVRLFEGAM